MQQEYDTLKARYANAPKKRVFLQFGSAPLFTSGPGSIQDQVLGLCGGENIFATSRVPWPQVSREQVLARQPQAIVVTGDASRIAEAQRFWQHQLTISLIALHSDWFERASPRIILAAKQLCAALDQVNNHPAHRMFSGNQRCLSIGWILLARLSSRSPAFCWRENYAWTHSACWC